MEIYFFLNPIKKVIHCYYHHQMRFKASKISMFKDVPSLFVQEQNNYIKQFIMREKKQNTRLN